MDKNEGAAIIREMIRAITNNPSQFHFRVEIYAVGQSVSVSGGGTRLSISATGGGPGSSVIGQSVSASVSNAEIKVMQDNANAER